MNGAQTLGAPFGNLTCRHDDATRCGKQEREWNDQCPQRSYATTKSHENQTAGQDPPREIEHSAGISERVEPLKAKIADL
jgi:hypothetical protein